MKTTANAIAEGISDPRKIPGLVLDSIKRRSGYKAFGIHGPAIKAAEVRHRLKSYQHSITSIWDQEWDLLIILDACRPEWIRQEAENYPHLEYVETIHSVGSHSKEFINATFNTKYADELSQTLYITGNHYANQIDRSLLDGFETAHDYGGWAYEAAAPPAHIITDLAISATRESSWDRCIVHYMQPHKPFLERGNNRTEYNVIPWSIGYEPYCRVLRGDLSVKDLHIAFRSNLRYVLFEVEILLKNIDASKVAITADHGQALGENGLWDHVIGVNHPSMRRVPWVETTAKDQHTHSPKEYERTDYDQATVQGNLEDLGYL